MHRISPGKTCSPLLLLLAATAYVAAKGADTANIPATVHPGNWILLWSLLYHQNGFSDITILAVTAFQFILQYEND